MRAQSPVTINGQAMKPLRRRGIKNRTAIVAIRSLLKIRCDMKAECTNATGYQRNSRQRFRCIVAGSDYQITLENNLGIDILYS